MQQLFYSILCRRNIQTVFQPIVSLENGTVLGYEALSRGPARTPLQNPEKLFTYAMENGQLWELESSLSYEGIGGRSCTSDQMGSCF